tara:strand:- start:3531 stop:4454 length:924 start_codon:yes stop_codon:yes gene_type:complete
MKILILGANGLVGSSLARNLSKLVPSSIIITSTRKDTDLFSFDETKKLIDTELPNIIINAAAKVGGIHANNTQRTEFILNNLKINMNILESLITYTEISLINLGSSCIYPLGANIPISEDSLHTGKLEPTNSPYAMAKLTAIEIGNALTQQHGHKIINLMPTNLYGPNDNFSETTSHVIPGLISRMHKSMLNEDKSFEVWGTGKPLREFMHVDDLTDAISFLINNKLFSESLLNVGTNEEVSINELVEKIKSIVGFEGEIKFNSDMPDGNPRKLLDSSKLNNFGWNPNVTLNSGLKDVYSWYLENNS